MSQTFTACSRGRRGEGVRVLGSSVLGMGMRLLAPFVVVTFISALHYHGTAFSAFNSSSPGLSHHVKLTCRPPSPASPTLFLLKQTRTWLLLLWKTHVPQSSSKQEAKRGNTVEVYAQVWRLCHLGVPVQPFHGGLRVWDKNRFPVGNTAHTAEMRENVRCGGV